MDCELTESVVWLARSKLNGFPIHGFGTEAGARKGIPASSWESFTSWES